MKSPLAACLLAVILSGCSRMPRHEWTCAEVLGPHPRPNRMEALPPGWSFRGSSDGEPDFRVWDERNHLVCDKAGKPVWP